MDDEYGEFRWHVLVNQREWQVHYFGAFDTKPSSDNDEFHDALEQFAETLSSTVLIVHVTFVTMTQWRPLLSLS
jgi:hypothetical protein